MMKKDSVPSVAGMIVTTDALVHQMRKYINVQCICIIIQMNLIKLWKNGQNNTESYGSYINPCGELILADKGNVYFTATDCTDKEGVICKLLEWCSRPIAKGEPYVANKRNIEWRNSLLCGFNNYLGTNFTLDDMYWIYDKLGNAANHKLTLEFIHSGFDLSLVRPQESEVEE